ncbi:hypothetical protein [Streptomyces sp. CB00455]|uniref:hypothetical protein n=1 Tax=Streptomyces sp. CB00455 TaxID=1703927 RepID=UPI0018FEE841|nr:hypothetical protein [Streptomyces sp. CB00455]
MPASIGGSRVRVELSNLFGEGAVRIAGSAIGVCGRFIEGSIDGQSSIEIPAGTSRWTDPVDLTVSHGDEIVVLLYLPESTPYTSANGFTFGRSLPGDFVGSRAFPLEGSTPVEADELREFPAPNTGTEPEADGNGWSLPISIKAVGCLPVRWSQRAAAFRVVTH